MRPTNTIPVSAETRPRQYRWPKDATPQTVASSAGLPARPRLALPGGMRATNRRPGHGSPALDLRHGPEAWAPRVRVIAPWAWVERGDQDGIGQGGSCSPGPGRWCATMAGGNKRGHALAVPKTGLEPARPYRPLGPEPSASANSATSALTILVENRSHSCNPPYCAIRTGRETTWGISGCPRSASGGGPLLKPASGAASALGLAQTGPRPE